MKKLFYLLIFGLILNFSDAFADQKNARLECQKIMRMPEVTISTSFGNLRYDHSKNSRTLTRMNQRLYGGDVGANRKVNGLATHDLIMELDFKVTKSQFADKITCIYPENINLKIGFKDPVIYITKDLEVGSCAYDVTLRHEQTHQEVNVMVLEHYLPIIKERFLEAVQKYALVTKDVNLTLAKDTLMKNYQSVIDPLLAEIDNEIKTEQAKLDRFENYDFEESLCH